MVYGQRMWKDVLYGNLVKSAICGVKEIRCVTPGNVPEGIRLTLV